RMGVPRAHRDAAARGQNRRAPLCWAELGARRRQRRGRQGRRQRRGQDAERHPLAQARGDGASRLWPAVGRHDGAADRHPGRRPRRRLRPSRRVAQRALFGGLRVLEEGIVRGLGLCCSQLARLARSFPSPLWGGARGGDGAIVSPLARSEISPHHPPPQPSPTRGEGAHRDRGGSDQPPPSAPSMALSAASALEPSGPPACAISARPPPPLPPSASAPLRTRSIAEKRDVRSAVTPTTTPALPSSVTPTMATTPEPRRFLPSSTRLRRSLRSMPSTARAKSFTSPTTRTPSAPCVLPPPMASFFFASESSRSRRRRSSSTCARR